MKLLAKSEVAKAKAADRQREVAEGLKLAGRVDSLREVAAHEEASLAKFRRETIEVIHAEIVAETYKRDLLIGEVSVLEDRKREALKPLDDQREELRQIEAKNVAWVDDLFEREVAVIVRDGVLSEREVVLQKLEEKARYTQEDAERRQAEAAIMETMAGTKNMEASEILRKAHAEAETLVSNAMEREEWVTQREDAVFLKEEELREKEIELAKDWSRLKDREATLERNIKRTKSKI